MEVRYKLDIKCERTAWLIDLQPLSTIKSFSPVSLHRSVASIEPDQVLH